MMASCVARVSAGAMVSAGGQYRSITSASPSQDATWRRTSSGVPAKASAVKPSLTVAENAAFWGGFLGGARGRLDVALEAFGLAALRDIPAGYLSAGQRRRAGLMRLVLADRPIWLLDEPTASLDDAAQAMLAAVVNRHLGGGGLVVAATHMPLGFDTAHELRLGRTAAAA